MTRPIACTSCDQRSCSRNSCAFPAGGQPVVLRPLVGLADAPLGLQPPALLEAVQRGIEGAGFDLEQVVGLRADGLADAVAVLRPPLEGPEDEHVEGALEQLQAPVVGVFGHRRRQSTALDVERLRLVPLSCGRAILAWRHALGRPAAVLGSGFWVGFWVLGLGSVPGSMFCSASGRRRGAAVLWAWCRRQDEDPERSRMRLGTPRGSRLRGAVRPSESGGRGLRRTRPRSRARRGSARRRACRRRSSGTLMQVASGGVIRAARSPRSSAASEFTIGCRCAATQPVSRSPMPTCMPRSVCAAGPNASAHDQRDRGRSGMNHAPVAPGTTSPSSSRAERQHVGQAPLARREPREADERQQARSASPPARAPAPPALAARDATA